MAEGWDRARRSISRAARATAGAGRGTFRAGRTAARRTAHAGGAAVRGTARAGRGVGRATRRLTHAQGAGRTGLGRLIELTAAHSAGDAMVTVALAGTLLFGLPVDQARGQVALYLLITMVPFTVVAPFVGPVLDRFRSGRRYIMAGTLLARGLLCWGMAAAIGPADGLTLFPAALAVLVLSKAYNVSRAATMPSVLPADIGLVTANARVALFALVSAGVAAPVAAGLTAWLGAEWVLRGTMVIFIAAGVGAVRLPRHVDAPDLEEAEEGESGEARRPRWRTLLSIGPVVGEAMRANAALRVLSGFLVFFLLFLVKDGHLRGNGLPQEALIAILAGGAGAGGLLGAAVASWIRGRPPQVIVLFALGFATVTAAASAFFFSLWTAVVVALVAGFAQEVGKLALDAVVQREIGEEVRSSTFGVVEALLQIAWVAGGLVGLLLSLPSGRSAGPIGLAIVAAALIAALTWVLTTRRRRLRARPRPVPHAPAPATPKPPPHTPPQPEPEAWTHTADLRPAGPEPYADGPRPGGTKPLTNPHG
ncbi:MFS transporter [Sphaerisporangium album]|uniref:MFS transporter n=1 Tax=Sphaerisporangium album TaxID=509200 RepID=A0A367EWF0_9ACTN|nr:MFS transporter [Sphaerisporangium album]RCG22476.1 MFS transporter [Sphaerisporangium album]